MEVLKEKEIEVQEVKYSVNTWSEGDLRAALYVIGLIEQVFGPMLMEEGFE